MGTSLSIIRCEGHTWCWAKKRCLGWNGFPWCPKGSCEHAGDTVQSGCPVFGCGGLFWHCGGLQEALGVAWPWEARGQATVTRGKDAGVVYAVGTICTVEWQKCGWVFSFKILCAFKKWGYLRLEPAWCSFFPVLMQLSDPQEQQKKIFSVLFVGWFYFVLCFGRMWTRSQEKCILMFWF